MNKCLGQEKETEIVLSDNEIEVIDDCQMKKSSRKRKEISKEIQEIVEIPKTSKKHLCQIQDQGLVQDIICQKCFQFKFTNPRRIEVNAKHTYTYEFDLEMSSNISTVLMKENVKMKLICKTITPHFYFFDRLVTLVKEKDSKITKIKVTFYSTLKPG